MSDGQRSDEPNEEHRRLTRRRLLKEAGVAAAALGVGGGLSACGANETAAPVPTDTNAVEFPPLPPNSLSYCSVMSFFTGDEGRTVDAIVSRLIPGDASDPGAHEAGVAAYIDTKLASCRSFATPTYFDPPFAKPVGYPPGPQEHAAKTILVQGSELPRYGFQSSSTPQEAYRKGLVALDRFTRKHHGDRFARLTAVRQDAVLEVLEAGLAAGFPEAKGFFKLVLQDTYEGMFSDPVYGGNRGYAGWKLVGYPGAQRAYTPDELQHGPRHKRVQALKDMPPMNPGVPQDHVILPVAGTRPEGGVTG
jgi:gluconate 2-dehydrogenase gamma chain